MAFEQEPISYEKTIISDLQGSWENLRDSVIEHFGFPNSDRLLFHINEAMSWESVRDLKRMKAVFLLVQNIAAQTDSPAEVLEWIDHVRDDLEASLEVT